jgi:hypothetical protein
LKATPSNDASSIGSTLFIRVLHGSAASTDLGSLMSVTELAAAEASLRRRHDVEI